MQQKQEIIQSFLDGDPKAFKALYDLFSGKVYNTALSYAQNEQDAEEITQDVFTSIFKNISHFKGASSIDTWIYRITVNTSLNLLKKKKRLSWLSFRDSLPQQSDFRHPGVLMEHQEHAQTLFKAIDRLPDKQKTAFILSFVEELPRQEVADIMEISLKAVESLLQRAKKNLRSRLEKWYPLRRKKA